MISPDWLPHRRASDDELVGYLLQSGDDVVPMTLLGMPLGMPQAGAVARASLDEHGLAILNERWWCRLPKPLSEDADANNPESDWEWRAVLVVEASPVRCTIRLENPTVEEFMIRVSLPVPVGDLLSKRQPE
jgi:hypothetical protein